MEHLTVDELTSRLYAAVGRPELWQAWFENLCRALDAPVGALLLRWEWGIGHGGHFAVGIPDEYHGPQYAPMLLDDAPLYEQVLASDAGEFMILSEPADAFLRSRFYNEWMRPQSLRHVLGGFVHRTPEHQAGLGVIRREGSPPFGDSEIRLLDRIAPHLRRTIELQVMLASAELQQRAASHALDAVRLAAAVVDESVSVLAANRRAETLFEAARGIRRERGRLRADTRHETTALQRLVRNATLGKDGDDERRGGFLAVSRGEGRPPLMAVVSPLRRSPEASPWEAPGTAVVFLTDPDEMPHPPEAGLRRLYGLTTAEARVAAQIAQGRSVEEIASASDVGISTVRTHLQHVFEKTGTGRQAELVRVLLTGAALLSE